MTEFINKLIERLEEKENEAVLKAPNTSDISNTEYQKWMMKSYGFKESIKIVNQLAEEYDQTIDVAELVEKFGQKKVRSNAERIRAMSDEELADNIAELGCDCCPVKKDVSICCTAIDSCKKSILMWLQSEVEG